MNPHRSWPNLKLPVKLYLLKLLIKNLFFKIAHVSRCKVNDRRTMHECIIYEAENVLMCLNQLSNRSVGNTKPWECKASMWYQVNFVYNQMHSLQAKKHTHMSTIDLVRIMTVYKQCHWSSTCTWNCKVEWKQYITLSYSGVFSFAGITSLNIIFMYMCTCSKFATYSFIGMFVFIFSYLRSS